MSPPSQPDHLPDADGVGKNLPTPFPDAEMADLSARAGQLIANARPRSFSLDLPISIPDPSAIGPTEGGPTSAFIVLLDGDAYSAELVALAQWVDDVLLPVYGREITAGRPWCARWREHPETVARLHALWLAWRELTSADASLSGPSTWHRDHLDHALPQLRGPDGAFAACTTNADRPHHRLLPPPAPELTGGLG